MICRICDGADRRRGGLGEVIGSGAPKLMYQKKNQEGGLEQAIFREGDWPFGSESVIARECSWAGTLTCGMEAFFFIDYYY